jgi:hypothetical protein
LRNRFEADHQVCQSKSSETKAAASVDPFERFFYYWIALVVAARRHRPAGQETDRDRFIAYLAEHSTQVVEVLGLHQTTMEKLAGRLRARHRGVILDTLGQVRPILDQLSHHYRGGPTLSPASLAQSFGEMVNKVRNNLFHGIKEYDSDSDRELLELINPVLHDLILAIEDPGPLRASNATQGESLDPLIKATQEALAHIQQLATEASKNSAPISDAAGRDMWEAVRKLGSVRDALSSAILGASRNRDAEEG